MLVHHESAAALADGVLGESPITEPSEEGWGGSPRGRGGATAMNGWLAACRLLSGRLVHPGSVPGPSRSVAAVAGLEVSWLPTPASTLTHCRVIFRERPHPPVTFLPVTSHLYPPSPRGGCLAPSPPVLTLPSQACPSAASRVPWPGHRGDDGERDDGPPGCRGGGGGGWGGALSGAKRRR